MIGLWLAPGAVQAAAGSKAGPRESWSQMQKLEYYIGQLSGALGICGYHALSRDLSELARLSPYGRKGLASVQVYDSIRGGQCGRLAADGEALLEDRDQILAYLADIYDCPGGACALKGQGSTSSPCQTELEDHLAALSIPKEDVQSVKIVSKERGVNHRFSGNYSHQAWISLQSCSGGLLVELTESCAAQNTFTRGDCEIEGIKGQ